MAGRMYEWRSGARFGVDPNDAGPELERLRKLNGGIRPQEVVDAARDESSPLHAAFEWDDSVAAEAHRRQVARTLCRSIRVVVKTENNGDMTEPMFVHVSVRQKPTLDDDGNEEGEGEIERYYERPSVVVKNPSLWESAVGSLERRNAQMEETILEMHAYAKRHAGKAAALDQVARATSRTRKAIEKAKAA